MTCRVYLGRLPYGTRQRDVEKFFRNYGRLREINLKDGYGFVVRLFLFTIFNACEFPLVWTKRIDLTLIHGVIFNVKHMVACNYYICLGYEW